MSSQSPLNRRVPILSLVDTFLSYCYVQFITSERQNSKLGGISIGHVYFITSELTDGQVLSLYHHIQFITSKR